MFGKTSNSFVFTQIEQTFQTATFAIAHLEYKSILNHRVTLTSDLGKLKKFHQLWPFSLKSIFIKVLPYVNETNDEPVIVTEDFPVKISCFLSAGHENEQNINWTWKFKNKTILQKACAATIVSNNTDSSLVFAETPVGCPLFLFHASILCLFLNLYS